MPQSWRSQWRIGYILFVLTILCCHYDPRCLASESVVDDGAAGADASSTDVTDADVKAPSDEHDIEHDDDDDDDDEEEFDLEALSDEDLEDICVSRGFELVREMNETTGESLEYTHEDYIDAAAECLRIEAELEEVLEKHPEIIDDVRRESERMVAEKEELERMLAEAQRMTDSMVKTGATADVGDASDDIDGDAIDFDEYVEEAGAGEEVESDGIASNGGSIVDASTDGREDSGSESESNSDAVPVSPDTNINDVETSGNATRDVSSADGFDETTNRNPAETQSSTDMFGFKEVFREVGTAMQSDAKKVLDVVFPKHLRGPVLDVVFPIKIRGPAKSAMQKVRHIAGDAVAKVRALMEATPATGNTIADDSGTDTSDETADRTPTETQNSSDILGLKELTREVGQAMYSDLQKVFNLVVPKHLRGPAKDALQTVGRISGDAATKAFSLVKRYAAAIMQQGSDPQARSDDGDERRNPTDGEVSHSKEE